MNCWSRRGTDKSRISVEFKNEHSLNVLNEYFSYQDYLNFPKNKYKNTNFFFDPISSSLSGNSSSNINFKGNSLTLDLFKKYKTIKFRQLDEQEIYYPNSFYYVVFKAKPQKMFLNFFLFDNLNYRYPRCFTKELYRVHREEKKMFCFKCLFFKKNILNKTFFFEAPNKSWHFPLNKRKIVDRQQSYNMDIMYAEKKKNTFLKNKLKDNHFFNLAHNIHAYESFFSRESGRVFGFLATRINIYLIDTRFCYHSTLIFDDIDHLVDRHDHLKYSLNTLRFIASPFLILDSFTSTYANCFLRLLKVSFKRLNNFNKLNDLKKKILTDIKFRQNDYHLLWYKYHLLKNDHMLYRWWIYGNLRKRKAFAKLHKVVLTSIFMKSLIKPYFKEEGNRISTIIKNKTHLFPESKKLPYTWSEEVPEDWDGLLSLRFAVMSQKTECLDDAYYHTYYKRFLLPHVEPMEKLQQTPLNDLYYFFADECKQAKRPTMNSFLNKKILNKKIVNVDLKKFIENDSQINKILDFNIVINKDLKGDFRIYEKLYDSEIRISSTVLDFILNTDININDSFQQKNNCLRKKKTCNSLLRLYVLYNLEFKHDEKTFFSQANMDIFYELIFVIFIFFILFPRKRKSFTQILGAIKYRFSLPHKDFRLQTNFEKKRICRSMYLTITNTRKRKFHGKRMLTFTSLDSFSTLKRCLWYYHFFQNTFHCFYTRNRATPHQAWYHFTVFPTKYFELLKMRKNFLGLRVAYPKLHLLLDPIVNDIREIIRTAFERPFTRYNFFGDFNEFSSKKKKK